MTGKNLWRVFVGLVLIAGLTINTRPAYALGTPQIVSISPGSPAPVGTNVSIRATVVWDNDFRSMRICFRDENWCQEDATPDITKNFDTSGLSAGTYQIIAEVAAKDHGWDSANKTYGSYELTGGQPQPPPPPPGPSQGPSLSTFTFSPGSATVGDDVDIHIVVNSSNPGATKINVSCGGVSKVETSEVDFHSTWRTSGCDAGTQRVTVLSRSVDDPNWQSATTTSSPYTLSAASNPVPVPSASFSVDSTNIQAGQCTYLHWSTSGADSVDIDGTNVAASGDKQVCPGVTTRYTLSAHNGSGTANRNVTVVVSSQPSSPSVANSFQTGDIINIGGNIYVIVNGQRRHVPNPDTLDALGIPRSWINNREYSDSDLNTIPQGPDIPDVNRDPSGFQAFKDWIFPSTAPIGQPAAAPYTPYGFSNGDIIQLGNDIFVMVDRQKRLVPNPDTLDALGISRSMINNKGFSVGELETIPRGADIPDANRDPSGFQSFKNWIFPNLSPIVIPIPNTQPQTGSFSFTVSPTSVAPGGNVTVQWSGYSPDGNDWISLHPAGRPDSEYLTWQYARGSSGSLTFAVPQQPGSYDFRLFRNGPKFATSNSFNVVAQPPQIPAGTEAGTLLSSNPGTVVNPSQQPNDSGPLTVYADEPPSPFALNECTDYVWKHRSDTHSWAQYGNGQGNAENWITYAATYGTLYGVTVDYGDLNKSQPGDIVVWSGSCGLSSAGHVAILVSHNGNTITVNEANWCSGGVCDHLIHNGTTYTFSSSYVPCLSFIHKPGDTTVIMSDQPGSSATPKEGTVQSWFESLKQWFKSWWPFGK